MAKNKLNINDLLNGEIDVVAKAEQIDREIGGVTRVEYHKGLGFNVVNHIAKYGINVIVPKKCEGVLDALACMLYGIAQKHGNYQAGEVHISKQASTKHHTEGIKQIVLAYTPKYA